MSSITTINSTDLITNSRADINTNFSNLNTDKIETSVLDTDTTLAANSDSKIPSQKAIKAYVDANSILAVSSETTSGSTHSLTTTATQRVVVWAKGTLVKTSTSSTTLELKYNGVSKDLVVQDDNTSTNNYTPFSLMYTETPGAATANITVTNDNAAIQDVKIIVLKFNV